MSSRPVIVGWRAGFVEDAELLRTLLGIGEDLTYLQARMDGEDRPLSSELHGTITDLVGHFAEVLAQQKDIQDPRRRAALIRKEQRESEEYERRKALNSKLK